MVQFGHKSFMANNNQQIALPTGFMMKKNFKNIMEIKIHSYYKFISKDQLTHINSP